MLSIAILFTGCELLGANEDETVVTTGVYVANQGNFGDGNGSVSVYDPEAGEVAASAIDGLGSIVQSLALVDGRLYVLANTGERIDVFDAASLTRVAQVTGLVSPRYMVVHDGRAYVTSLYGSAGSFTGGKVNVIDLATHTKVAEVSVGDNPEGLAVAAGRLYVANNGFGAGRTVTVIDAATNAVAETIDVDCDGPRFLVVDDEEDVFVFCTGRTLYDDQFNEIGETNGAVRVLDGETGAITARIEIDGRLGSAGPGQDAFYVEETEEAYVVKDGDTILRFDTDENALSGTIGPLAGAPIGAVAYDAAGERLYLARVPGFTERGPVTIHDRAGAEVGRFTAGVAPAYIAFRRTER